MKRKKQTSKQTIRPPGRVCVHATATTTTPPLRRLTRILTLIKLVHQLGNLLPIVFRGHYYYYYCWYLIFILFGWQVNNQQQATTALSVCSAKDHHRIDRSSLALPRRRALFLSFPRLLIANKVTHDCDVTSYRAGPTAISTIQKQDQ